MSDCPSSGTATDKIFVRVQRFFCLAGDPPLKTVGDKALGRDRIDIAEFEVSSIAIADAAIPTGIRAGAVDFLERIAGQKEREHGDAVLALDSANGPAADRCRRGETRRESTRPWTDTRII
jgi:hypothetical protein